MKKVIVLSFILFFFNSVVQSQSLSNKLDIQWGDEMKESRRETLADIVGSDETGFYALKVKGAFSPSFTLQHYNLNLKQTKEVELELEGKEGERELEWVSFLNGEIYVFSSRADKKTKKNKLYVQKVDKSSLQFTGTLQPLTVIDFSGEKKRNAGFFGYEISPDSSKYLIYYEKPYQKGTKAKYGLQVYDNQIKEIWNKTVTLPYIDQLFEIEQFEIDNRGNVHLNGVVFKDRRLEKRQGSPNYEYHVLSYTKDSDSFEEYVIKYEGKFLTDMRILVSDNDDLYCGGFYSSMGTLSIEGSFFLVVDSKTKETKSSSFYKFGIDFITQNMSDREEAKAKKKASKGKKVELYKYRLDDMILRSDGGVLLIGEQFYDYITTSTTYINGSASTTVTHHYVRNDIIVINISPDGKIDWTKKIGKRQHTTDDGGSWSSYALHVYGDKLYFVFNDNPKNLTYTGDGKMAYFNKGKSSIVALVELDMNGNQKMEALFTARDVEVLTMPRVCEQVSEKELIVFGQRGKTHRFAKISFN